MGVALFIVPEREVVGLETFVNGKALGRSNQLERLAHAAGVRQLAEFHSQNPEEAAALIEDLGSDVPREEFPPQEWFSAEDGLDCVRGLLNYLAANPMAIQDASAVTDDLREFEAVLAGLANAGVRWHLAIDF